MPPTLLTTDTNSSFHDTIQKAGALQVKEMEIQTRAVSLSNSVTLGKSLNLSETQFSQMCNRQTLPHKVAMIKGGNCGRAYPARYLTCCEGVVWNFPMSISCK